MFAFLSNPLYFYISHIIECFMFFFSATSFVLVFYYLSSDQFQLIMSMFNIVVWTGAARSKETVS